MSEAQASNRHTVAGNIAWFLAVLVVGSLAANGIIQLTPIQLALLIEPALTAAVFASAAWMAITRFNVRRPGEIAGYRTVLAVGYGFGAALLSILVALVLLALFFVTPRSADQSAEASHFLFGFGLRAMTQAVVTIVLGSVLAWVMIGLVAKREQARGQG